MKQLDVTLIRILQFYVFVFFTFLVLAYFGALLLLPLSLLVNLVRILTVIGLSEVISVLFALPVVVYLGYLVYGMPRLTKIIVDTGLELVSIGQMRIKGFDEIVATLKNKEAQSEDQSIQTS